MSFINPEPYYHHAHRSDDDPTHEYVDCVVHNNKILPDYKPQPLIFQQIKNSNIIDKADDYYISIIRWSLHSQIPVIIPSIKQSILGPNLVYTNDTDYFINIGYGSNPYAITPTKLINFELAYAINIKFINEDNSLLKPISRPVNVIDLYSQPYYYIKSIQHFLDMVNLALKESLDLIRGSSGSSPQKTLATSAVYPKFVWNSTTGKIDFLCSIEFMYDPDNNIQSKLFVGMNVPLFNLFDTFQNVCYNVKPTNSINPTPEDPPGDNYALVFTYNYGVSSHQENIGNTTKEIFINPQQSSSVPSWSPVASLVFNTYQVPVHNSLVASPDFLGENLDTTNSQNTLSNVLTDFQLPLIRGDEYTNQINYYIPTSEYRLFDLSSNSSIKMLNIVVNWIDSYGTSHPVLIKFGSTASIKIMFRKKNFNTY
jgi:hypothetical protein